MPHRTHTRMRVRVSFTSFRSFPFNDCGRGESKGLVCVDEFITSIERKREVRGAILSAESSIMA
jgi:hypothetical protein